MSAKVIRGLITIFWHFNAREMSAELCAAARRGVTCGYIDGYSSIMSSMVDDTWLATDDHGSK